MDQFDLPIDVMPATKQEAEELMNSVLPVAERMLKEHGEFYPYGGYVAVDGKMSHVGGKIDGTDRPESRAIIDLLIKNFQEKARMGEIKAAAIVFDVRIKPPGEAEKTDAIQVCLDHRDGYSAEVLFPYKISNGELLFGETFAQRGSGKIFPKA